jgi:hypothetical protein
VTGLSLAANGTVLYAAVQGGGVFRLDACLDNPVRMGEDSFSSIQPALDAAGASGESGIRLQSILFEEERLYVDSGAVISLSGGYDCSFAIQGPPATIAGGLTIENGTVAVDNIVLQ